MRNSCCFLAFLLVLIGTSYGQVPREVAESIQATKTFFDTEIGKGYAVEGKFYFAKYFRGQAEQENGKRVERTVPYDQPRTGELKFRFALKEKQACVVYQPLVIHEVYKGRQCAAGCAVYGDPLSALVTFPQNKNQPYIDRSRNYKSVVADTECQWIDPMIIYRDFLIPRWETEKNLKRPSNRPVVGPTLIRDSNVNGKRQVLLRTAVMKSDAPDGTPPYLCRDVEYDERCGFMPVFIADSGNGFTDMETKLDWFQAPSGVWMLTGFELTAYRKNDDGDRVINQIYRMNLPQLQVRLADAVSALEVARPAIPAGTVREISAGIKDEKGLVSSVNTTGSVLSHQDFRLTYLTAAVVLLFVGAAIVKWRSSVA